MKRNYVIYFVVGVALCAAAVGTVLGFIFDILALKILGIAGIVVALICLAVIAARDSVELPCNKLFRERKYYEERAFLEKKMRSPFYFLMRIHVLPHYIRVCMALDDLETASNCVDRLRHGGGTDWKYKTAYAYILIKLDEGDFKTARRDYESFRTHCAHADVYKTQIEILTAIFSRLLSVRDGKPLPESAVESNFPVVGRILGRHYEAQAVGEEWH